MCHVVIKMSKSLKKASLLKILQSERTGLHLELPIFFPEHILCTRNFAKSWEFIVIGQLSNLKELTVPAEKPGTQHIEYLIPSRSSINICLLNECWLYGNYQDNRKMYNFKTQERLLAKVKTGLCQKERRDFQTEGTT